MAESALIDELLNQYGLNPRRVFARLANEYRKQGDLTTAIEICRTQVPLQPTYISGYIVLGQALFESGQLDEARATFEAAIGLDPENLIALRQLGDIARMGGDVDAARGWYYRLLEVDPQNEDVSRHVRSLEAAPEAPPAPAGGGEHVSWSDINPERMTPPAPVMPPLPRLTLGMIPEDLSPEPVKQREPDPIEMSGHDDGAVSATPSMPAAAIPPAPPAPPAPAAPTPAFEITGLEDFAQFSAPIAPPPPTPRSSAILPDIAMFAPGKAPPAADLPPLVAQTGEFSAASLLPRASVPQLIPEPEFKAPRSDPVEEEPALWSPPVTAEHPAPEPPATDSLRDTQAFPTPRSVEAMNEPPAAPPPPAPRATDARGAVDNWGSIPEADAPAPAQSQEEAYDPTVGRMLDLNVNSGNELPPAFMTETMAELYLQQGYHAEALHIYRQLAAMRPDDPSLRERISRLERGARSSVSEVASISEDVISAAQARASRPVQTSRSFFGGLAARRAPVTPPDGSLAPSVLPSVAPSVAAPAPVASPTPPSAPLAFAPEPESAAEVHTELNGMFAGRVPVPDDAAATALAGAFSEEFSGGAIAPAAGQPSRAASQPLSLDDVFRGQRPTTEAQRSSPSVTFDEFFAPRDSGSMAVVHPAVPPRPDAPGAVPGAPVEADLALFHEWLDGLKK